MAGGALRRSRRYYAFECFLRRYAVDLARDPPTTDLQVHYCKTLLLCNHDLSFAPNLSSAALLRNLGPPPGRAAAGMTNICPAKCVERLILMRSHPPAPQTHRLCWNAQAASSRSVRSRAGLADLPSKD